VIVAKLRQYEVEPFERVRLVCGRVIQVCYSYLSEPV
jgi:hypothetical protein